MKKLLSILVFSLIMLVFPAPIASAAVDISIEFDIGPGVSLKDGGYSIDDGVTTFLKITIKGPVGEEGKVDVWSEGGWFAKDRWLGWRSYKTQEVGELWGETTVDFPISAFNCEIIGTGENTAEIFVTGPTVFGKPSNKITVTCDKVTKKVMGPGGGTLDDMMGKITIPPGALAIDTEITFETLPIPDRFATPAKQEILVARRVGPSGLTFLDDKKATIAIPYDLDRDVAALGESRLEVFAFNTSTRQWVPIPFTIDQIAKDIIIQTSHFSIYGIGGSPPIPTGYNTYWLMLTAVSLMLAGGYLLFRRKEKLFSTLRK